jgi:hypothetical protein
MASSRVIRRCRIYVQLKRFRTRAGTRIVRVFRVFEMSRQICQPRLLKLVYVLRPRRQHNTFAICSPNENGVMVNNYNIPHA